MAPGGRAGDIGRLTGETMDVLVVGGGISGAGCALDAVSRGLSVGLVEAQDWAAGTSSRSSKLIHGGLRYLEMMDVALVHQALQERAILLRLAPHLVRPLPILYPLRRAVVERAYVGAGIALYDLLGLSTGTSRGLPLHRHLSRRRALELAPGLRRESLVGAIEYYDAQVDDARYVLEVVRTAVHLGVVAVNRMAVVGFLRDGERVIGARLRDSENGQEHEVRSRATILATGAWTEETEALAGRQRAVRVRPSKGVHLVVPRDRLRSEVAVVVRTEKSVLFVLPWGRHWLIGTTDTDWVHDKARPLATAADVEYLLRHVNAVLETPISPDDVEAVFAGLRPLVAGVGVVRGPGEAGATRLRHAAHREPGTTTISREHAVGRPAPGVVAVSGGKYTTYRVMAADAVDAAVKEAGLDAPPSVTDRLPLLGATGYSAWWNQRQGLARAHRLPADRVAHLLGRYGAGIDEVLAAVDADPTLGEPIAAAPDHLRVEAVHAVTHEGARHLEDVLQRRTRIGIEYPHGGVESAAEVADLIGPLLGWDEATRTGEIEDLRRGALLVETAASTAEDDEEAARMVKETPTRLALP